MNKWLIGLIIIVILAIIVGLPSGQSAFLGGFVIIPYLIFVGIIIELNKLFCFVKCKVVK